MFWNPSGEQSDSDEEPEFVEAYGGREALIFLIDAFLYENTERFQKCLEIIRNALLNGLLTRDKDLIGVVFCNTKNSPEPKDSEGLQNVPVPENTAVLLPLRQLSKDIVDYYLNFATPDYFDFGNKYGVEEGSFAKTLWLCTNLFKQCGFKLGNSSIVLFTDRDSPHAAGSGDYQKAIQKASDLQETDIDFLLIPMKDDFDCEPFYKEFLCTVRDIELDAFYPPDPVQERNMITDRQTRQNCKKRCNVHLKWTLGGDTMLSVGLYNYYRRNVYPRAVKMLREDNSVIDVKRVRKLGTIDPDSNDITDERYCKPGDERKVITVGGQKIVFTSDELARMRSPLVPGLTLLGFKPKSTLSIHNFVKSPAFIYPDEKVINGSTKLFRALWEKCLERDKVAICVLVTRRKSPPRYVALVPTATNNSEDGGGGTSQMQNDGFRVVFLPYEIDYRNMDLSDLQVPNVSNDEIDIFQQVIKKLKCAYDPTMIKDPSLEILQANIAGLAFDIEIEGAETSGMPDVEKQDSRIDAISEKIADTFGADPETAPKRGRTGNDAGGQPAKVARITDEHPSRDQIEQLIASNNLNTLTAKQLKAYLQGNDVKNISSATKAVLIEKVIEYHS